MSTLKLNWRVWGALAALGALAPFAHGADEHTAPRAAAAPNEQVEMFSAMEKGDIDVTFIPKNDREARVILKNNTKRPLSIRLPDAFAGVPVLAQAAGGGRAGGRGGAAAPAGGMMNQGMGGGMGGMGMGGMGMGGGGMGMGGGMFNIPAEKVAKFKVDTVCLEHGKKDPRPAVPYKIVPIASFTDKPEVQELCKMLGEGKIDQRRAGCRVASGQWHDLATAGREGNRSPLRAERALFYFRAIAGRHDHCRNGCG